MARGRAKGARGSTMVNASIARSKAARFARTSVGGISETVEVPYYMVGLKKNGKNTHLNQRRNRMKAKMSLKAGVSGYGCVEGILGSISYPTTDKEKELLTAISAIALNEPEPAGEQPAGPEGGPGLALEGPLY